MTKLKEMPSPLLKQAVLRFGGSALSLFVSLCAFLIYGEPYLSLSMLAITFVTAASGIWLYYIVAAGKYIVVEGICQKVDQTLVFRKSKTVYVFVNPHTIRMVPHRRNVDVHVGDTLRIYIASRTPVYHADNCEVLSGYLAMEILKGAGK